MPLPEIAMGQNFCCNWREPIYSWWLWMISVPGTATTICSLTCCKNNCDPEYDENIPALHRQASQWYAQNGSPREAVAHALKTEDWDFAATVIEEFVLDLIQHGEMNPGTALGEFFAGRNYPHHAQSCAWHRPGPLPNMLPWRWRKIY